MPKTDYATARKRVRELKAFYVHAAIFVAVLAVLLVVDIATMEPYWVHWVVLGWGLGVIGHAFRVKISNSHESGSAVHRWEQRKIKELMGVEEP